MRHRQLNMVRVDSRLVWSQSVPASFFYCSLIKRSLLVSPGCLDAVQVCPMVGGTFVCVLLFVLWLELRHLSILAFLGVRAKFLIWQFGFRLVPLKATDQLLHASLSLAPDLPAINSSLSLTSHSLFSSQPLLVSVNWMLSDYTVENFAPDHFHSCQRLPRFLQPHQHYRL